MWHDIRSAGAEALGTYVTVGLWMTKYNRGPELEPESFRHLGVTHAAGEHLVRVGLWRKSGEGFRVAVTLRDLQRRRGHRGPIMLLSNMLRDSGVVSVSGMGSFGAWSLAASWSLANCQPGFVPHAAVAELGIEDYALALWKPDYHFGSLWERARGGYRMTLHDGCIHERYWEVGRDDVRAPIPREVRERVFARNGAQCVQCGSPEDLAVDHIYPWSRGGSDDEDNLQALCQPCNSRKRDALPLPPAPPTARRKRSLEGAAHAR